MYLFHGCSPKCFKRDPVDLIFSLVRNQMENGRTQREPMYIQGGLIRTKCWFKCTRVLFLDLYEFCARRTQMRFTLSLFVLFWNNVYYDKMEIFFFHASKGDDYAFGFIYLHTWRDSSTIYSKNYKISSLSRHCKITSIGVGNSWISGPVSFQNWFYWFWFCYEFHFFRQSCYKFTL